MPSKLSNDAGLGQQLQQQAKRQRTKYFVRHSLDSDSNSFVGRICDLSIVALHFDDYASLSQHKDCKYVFDINAALETLVRRVESLNLVGEMLWPESIPRNIKDFPISRYEWLTVAADVFLMRYISVVDCALLLVSEIYETKLEPWRCSFKHLRDYGVDVNVMKILEGMIAGQGDLRTERNSRFHHGTERSFTRDDQVFRMAALFERRSNGLVGKDRYGRKINVERYFKEGLVALQKDFNTATRKLIKNLDLLYDQLGNEVEARFVPRFRERSHGFGVGKRIDDQ